VLLLPLCLSQVEDLCICFNGGHNCYFDKKISLSHYGGYALITIEL
jgi:hypothetical protein